METKNRNLLGSIIVVITYLAMIAVNTLANILPINGRSTGDVSDAYSNLFAPAGITFSIWSLIYFLLLGYSLYQLINRKSVFENKAYKRVAFWFIISSIANILWIFAWHYEVIWLTLILMLVLLTSLIIINLSLRNVQASKSETLFIKIPFAVYFGWITIATIANITTFLVLIEWNRFGMSEVFWTVVIVIVGAIIGFLAEIYYKSFSYGAVIIWAYLGIIIKHTSSQFFDGKYPAVIVAVVISIILVIIGQIIMLKNKSKRGGDINES